MIYKFYGASRRLEVIADAKWPPGADGPPDAIPFCGFDNENPACDPTGMICFSRKLS